MNSPAQLLDDRQVMEELACGCVLTRTRLISRVLTGIYDEALRPFQLKSPQFSLLVVISKIEPASRAEIGRFNQFDRSTLTRNLQLLLSEGWVQETQTSAGGRARPIVLTAVGRKLLVDAAPVWRTAQVKAAELLGPDGMSAVMKIGDSMMNLPQTA